MTVRNGEGPGADAALAAMAATQHGVVTRRQLLAAGLTRAQVELRLRRGQLYTLSPGVYAVGHPGLTRDGRRLAAAWSGGPAGMLCDVAAAELHGVRESNAALWDVLVPRRTMWTPPPGIRAHITTTLRPHDQTVVDGVPVTSLARTVVDLAARHPPRLVERVLDRMVVLRLYDQRALDDQLAVPYLRGARQLRSILASHTPGTTVTKSALEELLLALCDRFGLPRPHCNAWVARVEVDAHWPGTPYVAELDSARFHSSRSAFERDREKQNLLVAAGYVVLRFTWRQLADDPAGVARTLRAVLG